MVKLKIQSDVLHVAGQEGLVIASDNSGAIGEKPLDKVPVSYETVAYFLFRVAYMECVSSGAFPLSVVLHNFNGDAAWEKLLAGVYKGYTELGIAPLPVTGSSESNFTMQQSATSLSIVGKIEGGKTDKQPFCEWEDTMSSRFHVAVVGQPLVGADVLIHADKVASLQTYKWLSEQEEVVALIPVGSKGIDLELKKIHPEIKARFCESLDTKKSAGPATCYIVVYEKTYHSTLEEQINDALFVGSW